MTTQEEIVEDIRELKGEIKELKGEIEELKGEIGKLKEEFGELENKQQLTPTGSSLQISDKTAQLTSKQNSITAKQNLITAKQNSITAKQNSITAKQETLNLYLKSQQGYFSSRSSTVLSQSSRCNPLPNLFRHLMFTHSDSATAQVQLELTSLRLEVRELRNEFNVSEYDVWTEQGRTEVEQTAFKNGLIKYYRRNSFVPFSNQLHCMVTSEWHNREDVIASHIWPSKTRGKGLPKFGLSFNDLMNPRNGFLVLKDIEDKFDRKQLCFLYDPLVNPGKYVVKILDPSIRGLIIKKSKGESRTFESIDGAELQHPPGKFPYRRLLGFHARCAYAIAREKNWIPPESIFREYFDISSTASAPDTYL